jgi:hypothetical protein
MPLRGGKLYKGGRRRLRRLGTGRRRRIILI